MNYNVSGVATYRQYDTRWGSTGYRRAPWTMAYGGCGPTACANIIAAKQGITPAATRDYFISHGYCADSNGSYWAGIPACLRTYGFSVTEHATMTGFLAEMAKGNRMGVILFKAGTRGGVTWTMGGHFMAVSGYKEAGGKHWLYMHDSGSRRHDGWYCYEDHMKGLCAAVWSCTTNGVSGGAVSGSTPSSSAPAVAGTAVSEPVRYVVPTEGLNARTGPGTNYPVIKTWPKGTPIKIVRRVGNWGYSKGAGGWLCTDYLSGSTAGAVSHYTRSGYALGMYHVNTAGLNVRSGPGTGYKKVGLLYTGTPLRILKVSGNWGYSRGAGGWVHLGYCRKG